MANIIPPSPPEIWALVEGRLTPSHLGFTTEDQVLGHIESLISEAVEELDSDVDLAALPHDFPFSDEFLESVYPALTDDQRSAKIDTQQSKLRKAIAQYCLWKLYTEKVRASDAFYRQWGLDAKANYEALKKEAFASISRTAGMTPESQEEQSDAGLQSSSGSITPEWY